MPENKNPEEKPSQRIPVRPPPAQQIPAQQQPRPSAREAYSSEGTASDPNVTAPSAQNLTGSLNTSYPLGNPGFVPHSNIHTTCAAGPAPAHYQTQQQQARPVSVFPQALPPTFPPAILCQPGLFQQQQPAFLRPQPGVPYYNTANPNPYFVRTNTPTTHITIYHTSINMPPEGYSTMPNTGQNFQPPVPDTTYGPMQHVYRPRFDNGVPSAGPPPGSPRCFSLPGPYPHTGPLPQQYCVLSGSQPQQSYLYAPNVTSGYATAPMAIPMTAQQQPPMVYGVQSMQGAQPQPYFTGPGYQMAMPMQPQGQPLPGYPLEFVTPGTAPECLPGGTFPDIMGIGRTHGENTAELLAAMQKGDLLEAQDIKPKDDDPSRMYLLRELDGNWTRRSRFELDHLACRWYLTPWGGFYAVRLED